MMYLNPWFSTPTRLDTGTRTSSNVTYVVPDAQTPMQSMRLQLTPGMVFSTTSTHAAHARPARAHGGGEKSADAVGDPLLLAETV